MSLQETGVRPEECSDSPAQPRGLIAFTVVGSLSVRRR